MIVFMEGEPQLIHKMGGGSRQLCPIRGFFLDGARIRSGAVSISGRAWSSGLKMV